MLLETEQEAYESLLAHTPKVGAYVATEAGRGTVVESNLLTGLLRVRMDNAPDAAPRVFMKEEVRLIRDQQIRVAKEELEQLKSLE